VSPRAGAPDPDALALQPDGDALVLKVRAAPGASRERIVGIHGDALKVAVRAPPERGKANDGILALLAQALSIPTRDLALVSGDTSRDKRVRVAGLSRAELLARLRDAL
jgi:uncharacterized protein (TIGR00251 family)